MTQQTSHEETPEYLRLMRELSEDERAKFLAIVLALHSESERDKEAKG